MGKPQKERKEGTDKREKIRLRGNQTKEIEKKKDNSAASFERCSDLKKKRATLKWDRIHQYTKGADENVEISPI